MLSNELLFILIMLLDMAFVTFMARLGREYLQMSIIANLLFTNFISSKIVTVFGISTTIGNATYAAIFLATDLLCEHYGKSEAVKVIKMGFVALLLIIVLGPIASQLTYPEFAADTGQAVSFVLSNSTLIALSSLTAYVISTRVDIEAYIYLKDKLPQRTFLFIRNNVSTFIGQLVDQAIFVTLAFGVRFPLPILFELFITGSAIKMAAAIIDTPFMYIGYSRLHQRARNDSQGT